jgi:hypothetical protein
MPALASIPPTPTLTELSAMYERARRARLRVLGIDGAYTMPADMLADALRDANERATDNEELAAAIVLHSPDQFTAERLRRLLDDSTPGEAASTLTAMFGRLVEPHELAAFTPLEIGGLV